jgi:hypothetical protein
MRAEMQSQLKASAAAARAMLEEMMTRAMQPRLQQQGAGDGRSHSSRSTG